MLKHLEQLLSRQASGLQTESEFHQSAVLVPLIEHNGELNILFEVRAGTLTWQPGEICFPGGHIEPADLNPSVTAMRETSEELGICLKQIKLLGPLKTVISPIGAIIHAYAGHLTAPVKLNPNPAEVGEIFLVPLNTLLTLNPIVAHAEIATRPCADFPLDLVPPNYATEWRHRLTYKIYFYTYQERVIWGITALILHDLLSLYKSNE